jgi:small subunit ribosomal protein S20
MPHHKSAAKRVKTNEERRQRNLAAKSRLRHAIKSVRAATSKSQAETAYRAAVSVLDRTASKGIIKRETADRHKARLALFCRKLPA